MRHFQQAATVFRVWILVRDTNKASLDYIDKAKAGQSYHPKPIDCKPKTADRNPAGREHAGLVVDPVASPESFSPDKLKSALKEWEKWPWQQFLDAADKGRPKPYQAQTIHGEPAGTFYYRVDLDRSSKHYGGLMRGESAAAMCYLFGDYDLKDIVDPDHPAGNLAAVEKLHGQLSLRGPKVYPVQDFINEQIGVPVLQHGGDAQARPHAPEVIHVWSPQGKYSTLTAEWQQKWFYEGLSLFGFKLSRVSWLDRLQKKLGGNVFDGRRTLPGKRIKEDVESYEEWVKEFEGEPPSTYKPWTPRVIQGGKK
jgi:hypothetical protein